MVYEFGKKQEKAPNTFVIQVREPEPQEPRPVVTQARPFYTIPQLAELLQVHENTIYRLVRAGKVEHYKIGAQIRISAAELERLKVERKA